VGAGCGDHPNRVARVRRDLRLDEDDVKHDSPYGIDRAGELAQYGGAVADVLFEDHYLASLYDLICVDRGDEDYYLHLIESASSVLDVGCGTGTSLHRARAAGHRGRLVGIDPADGMLAQARRYPDIEWIRTTLPDAGFSGEFDLVFMTGHAFQVLLSDDAVNDFLAAAHLALRPTGRLAFETRNPLARAWERWTPDAVTEVVDQHGATVRVWHEVESVDGECVTFTESYASSAWPEVKVSTSTLRFVPAEHLDHLLAGAGFVVDERYGNWDRSLFTPHSPEIITVASPR
jgi:SAM-dependent methyltransferase